MAAAGGTLNRNRECQSVAQEAHAGFMLCKATWIAGLHLKDITSLQVSNPLFFDCSQHKRGPEVLPTTSPSWQVGPSGTVRLLTESSWRNPTSLSVLCCFAARLSVTIPVAHNGLLLLDTGNQPSSLSDARASP